MLQSVFLKKCHSCIFNRKVIATVITPALWFSRTDVVTINQGHEEVGDCKHNIQNGLINTLDKGKTKCLQDVLLKSARIVFCVVSLADKRGRCLCCWRLQECEKKGFHLVSLYPLSYWFPLQKTCTVYTGKAKLHYLAVSCYLEVVGVKKPNGL